VFSNGYSLKRLINGASRRAGRHALNLQVIRNVRWFVPLFVKGRSIALWSPLRVQQIASLRRAGRRDGIVLRLAYRPVAHTTLSDR